MLVGDAAGLVNPLQGEGIAQAMASGRAAAGAVLDRPGQAAASYRRWAAETYGPFASVTTPMQATLVGHPRRIAALAAVLTAPVFGPSIASTWAIYWNDLMTGGSSDRAVRAASAVQHIGQALTIPSRLRRSLRNDLGDRASPVAL